MSRLCLLAVKHGNGGVYRQSIKDKPQWWATRRACISVVVGAILLMWTVQWLFTRNSPSLESCAGGSAFGIAMGIPAGLAAARYYRKTHPPQV